MHLDEGENAWLTENVNCSGVRTKCDLHFILPKINTNKRVWISTENVYISTMIQNENEYTTGLNFMK